MFRECRSSAYCLVEHVARSVYLGVDWPAIPMLMLSGYYDRSGDTAVTIVAGYVSEVGRWKDFDAAWKAFLRRPEYAVPYFHMKEFAHSTGVFAVGWKGEHRKQREFLAGLIEIIRTHAFRGFGSAVETKVYEEFTADPAVQRMFPNAYAYCGRAAVGKASSWAKREKWQIPMQSVFEDGDEGWGELVRVLKRDGHPVPIQKPKVPRNEAEALDCLTPLQAADFAAYEMLKYYRLAASGDSDWDDVRESFKALEKYPVCEWGIASAENMKGFLETLRIAKASELDHPPGYCE